MDSMGFLMQLLQGGLGSLAVFLTLLAGTLYMFSKPNLQINARYILTSAE